MKRSSPKVLVRARTESISRIILNKAIRVSLGTVRQPRRIKIIVSTIRKTRRQMLMDFVDRHFLADCSRSKVQIFTLSWQSKYLKLTDIWKMGFVALSILPKFKCFNLQICIQMNQFSSSFTINLLEDCNMVKKECTLGQQIANLVNNYFTSLQKL